MEYNTSREKLILPEYGRHVQKMVQQMKEIADKDERTRTAYAIIGVMGNMFPQLKEVLDFKQKLWDQLMIMADFDLDIDAPYPLPDRSFLDIHVDRVPYQDLDIRYMHYGKLVDDMIQAAIDMRDMEQRKYMAFLIANHMKRSYLKWNKDVVNDGKIYDDLRDMSQRILDYTSDDFGLVEVGEVVTAVRKSKNPNKSKS